MTNVLSRNCRACHRCSVHGALHAYVAWFCYGKAVCFFKVECVFLACIPEVAASLCTWHASNHRFGQLPFMALQDFAFIEQQRQLVFGSPTRGSWSTTNHKVETQEDAPIKGEDYQKLKSWKDAVGAPTFSQLHARCTRCGC